MTREEYIREGFENISDDVLSIILSMLRNNGYARNIWLVLADTDYAMDEDMIEELLTMGE